MESSVEPHLAISLTALTTSSLPTEAQQTIQPHFYTRHALGQ